MRGTAHNFNANNQDIANTYDGNGNPTTYNGSSLQFDPENRLTQYGSSVSNTWNGDGLRAKKTFNGGGAYNWFVYDGDEPVCEVDGSGNVAALHTFGANGLVSRRCNGVTAYYAFDPSGNGALLLDGSGNVLTSAVVDSFGNTVSTGSSVYSAFLAQGGQWGYYQDGEDGLALLGHRFYDKSTGRFLTRDPIDYKGGINLYAYCDNNPVNNVDPSGFGGRSSCGGPYHPPPGVHTACTINDDCETIYAKMYLLERMIESHEGWDKSMPPPRGGDRHTEEIKQLYKQYANCLKLLKKCKPRKPYDPPVQDDTGNIMVLILGTIVCHKFPWPSKNPFSPPIIGRQPVWAH